MGRSRGEGEEAGAVSGVRYRVWGRSVEHVNGLWRAAPASAQQRPSLKRACRKQPSLWGFVHDQPGLLHPRRPRKRPDGKTGFTCSTPVTPTAVRPPCAASRPRHVYAYRAPLRPPPASTGTSRGTTLASFTTNPLPNCAPPVASTTQPGRHCANKRLKKKKPGPRPPRSGLCTAPPPTTWHASSAPASASGPPPPPRLPPP